MEAPEPSNKKKTNNEEQNNKNSVKKDGRKKRTENQSNIQENGEANVAEDNNKYALNIVVANKIKKRNIKQTCKKNKKIYLKEDKNKTISKKTTVVKKIVKSNVKEDSSSGHTHKYKNEAIVNAKGNKSKSNKNIVAKNKTESYNAKEKSEYSSQNHKERGVAKEYDEKSNFNKDFAASKETDASNKKDECSYNNKSQNNIKEAKKTGERSNSKSNIEVAKNIVQSDTKVKHHADSDTSNSKKEDIEKEDENKSDLDKDLKKKMKVAEYLQAVLYESGSAQREIRIGDTTFLINGQIISPKENLPAERIIGKKCRMPYIWINKPPLHKIIMSKSIGPYEVGGPIGSAKEVESELAAFNIYITKSMLQNILKYTNEEIKISEYYIFPKPTFMYPISLTELQAFIGILFLHAVRNDSKISSSLQWDMSGSDVYNTVISKDRFEYIIKHLRFDDCSTRNMRKSNDSFAEVREIWDEFITKCFEVYKPSGNCTVDEMFVDFNGNCMFKWPSPRQLKESCIKLILLCDSNNRYLISGIPHLHQNNNGGVPLAEFLVEKLATPLSGTNVNITYASDMFTSISLSKKMFNYYRLTTVGILQNSLSDIPPPMILEKNRPAGTSIFVYNIEDKLQLCSYFSKKRELKVFLSNIHFDTEIEGPEGQPKVLKYYESTKDGVKAVLQMIYGSNCSKQTAHWFLAIFFAILDFAGINSFTILNLCRWRHGKPSIKRVDFLYNLAFDLMLPFMKERLIDSNTSESVKNNIKYIIEERQKVKTASNQSNNIKPTVNVSLNNELVASAIKDYKQTMFKKFQQELFYPWNLILKPGKTNIWDEIISMYPLGSDKESKLTFMKTLHTENNFDNFTESLSQAICAPMQFCCMPITSHVDMTQQLMNFNIQQNLSTYMANLYTTPSQNNSMLPYINTVRSLGSGHQIPNRYMPVPYIQPYMPYNSVPIMQQYIPNMTQNLSQNISNMPQNSSNVQQNGSYMRQNISNMYQTAPHMYQNAPHIYQNIPHMVQNAPNTANMQHTVLNTQPYVPYMTQHVRQRNVPYGFQNIPNMQPNLPNQRQPNIFSQPITHIQQVNSASNTQQCAPYPNFQQIQPDQIYQPNIFYHNIIPNQQTFLPCNLPAQANASIQNDTKLKRELWVCGICNYVGNQNFFEECFKCSVLLCMVHRKILCIECCNIVNISISRLVMSDKGKCKICLPKGKIQYSTRCCKCLNFVCLEHRRVICSFCAEM